MFHTGVQKKCHVLFEIDITRGGYYLSVLLLSLFLLGLVFAAKVDMDTKILHIRYNPYLLTHYISLESRVLRLVTEDIYSNRGLPDKA